MVVYLLVVLSVVMFLWMFFGVDMDVLILCVIGFCIVGGVIVGWLLIFFCRFYFKIKVWIVGVVGGFVVYFVVWMLFFIWFWFDV